MKRIVYIPAAQLEYRAAMDYHDAQRFGLGDRFVAAVEAAINGFNATRRGSSDINSPAIDFASCADFVM